MRERHPTLPIARVLSADPEPEWSDELDQALTAGNEFFSEVVWLHKASGTLILTDLIENLYAEHVGLMWRLFIPLLGQWQKPVPAPEHRWFLFDPDAFERSIERVRTWEFDRVILAHGRFLENEAKQTFDAVMDRMIDRARRRWWITRSLLRIAMRLE